MFDGRAFHSLAVGGGNYFNQSISFITDKLHPYKSSNKKPSYLERVHIQYISPVLPQGRRKQTVTPYNTMQDHIVRFCSTLHKYVCMFSN